MAQLKDTTIDGALEVNGAAIFGDEATTRQGLNYMGANPHGTIDDDTTTKWASLGSGWCWVSAANIANYPDTQSGFLQNMVTNDGYVFQVLHVMDGVGDTYTRSGNPSGWYEGSANWVKSITGKTVMKKLWSGSWSSGSITVPNTSDYTMFLIGVSGHGTWIPAFEQDENYVRGMGGYVNATPTDYSYQFGATLSGNTWTYVYSDYLYHGSGSTHGTRSKTTISSIWGVI